MRLGRYYFTFNKVKKEHKCGECGRKMRVGDQRMVISGGGYTYKTHVCMFCANKIGLKIHYMFINA